MTKEGISESEAQKLLYTGGFTIEATVNTKLQSQMENLMLNTNDAYFPAGWHEEEVTSISDDDVQVFNEDGTPTDRTKKILAATPMGHFGDSEKDLVGALLFLLNNDAAGFITGICLPVDGGFSAYSGV